MASDSKLQETIERHYQQAQTLLEASTSTPRQVFKYGYLKGQSDANAKALATFQRLIANEIVP